MESIEMIKGAQKILDECMGVKRGETVLILADADFPFSVAEVLALGCKERNAIPVIMIMSPVTIDGTDPPPPVGEAMQKAQVVLLGIRGIFHGPSRNRATKTGTRFLIMSEFTEEDMFRGSIEADFIGLKKPIDQIYEAFANAMEVQVTTPAGTDLYFDLRNRLEKIVKFNGIYHQPGEGGSINLEIAVSPTPGSTRGVMVCDASTTLLKPGFIREAVHAKIEDGRITEIRGGGEAKRIEDLLAGMNDTLVYNVVELGIGLNPKTPMIPLSGGHRDKGIYGTCHIGIGSNITWGGTTKAAVHADFVMYAPTIKLDGKIILENYKFRI